MSRRSLFVVSGSPEKFIVPVLDNEISAILKFLTTQLPPRATVLDIGCGNQPLRKSIEERGWIYKSLDIAQNDQHNVDFVAAIDRDTEIQEQFDLLLCTEVMEHVVVWEKAFDNIFRLCKVNGKVLITCPFFYPLHEEPYDHWRPTNHTLRSFAERYGFSVLQLKKAGTVWEVLGTLLNSIYITASGQDFRSRMRSKILIWLIGYLKKQISNSEIYSYAKAEGSWYLSNIVLLEKRKK